MFDSLPRFWTLLGRGLTRRRARCGDRRAHLEGWFRRSDQVSGTRSHFHFGRPLISLCADPMMMSSQVTAMLIFKVGAP